MTSSAQRVAIITGAGAGIGKATALRFAAAGYVVVIADISTEQAEMVSKSLQDDGHSAIACTCDVANQNDCDLLTEQTLDHFGRIDVLVANAGIQTGGTLLEMKQEDWQQVLAVNLNGVAYSCKAVLPAMIQQKSGAIVITSSINAIVGTEGMAVYNMAKTGVLGLMRNLAVEHGRQGIRVNAICPGNTITDFHIDNFSRQGIGVDEIRNMTSDYGLLGRAAEPEEIANAILFLASDAASFITGHTLVADGGFSVT